MKVQHAASRKMRTLRRQSTALSLWPIRTAAFGEADQTRGKFDLQESTVFYCALSLRGWWLLSHSWRSRKEERLLLVSAGAARRVEGEKISEVAKSFARRSSVFVYPSTHTSL
jgi:hypothetical protein